MIKLVLLRHGESLWNKENRFTGWTDVDLSEKGVQEAKDAGKILKKKGFEFDIAFTSVLKRATKTLDLALEELGQPDLPTEYSWHQNERHYGALQGLNKDEMRKKVGEEQVHIWRRSFATPPPALELDDPRHPKHDPKYKDLTEKELPAAESLEDTINRFMPYWEKSILPELKNGKRIIISSHGNSLRALVKHLDGISDEEIPNLNIPTGNPLVYELDDNLKPIRHYYLKEN